MHKLFSCTFFLWSKIVEYDSRCLKNLFSKKEMSNFRYDDDVLLKWEITGTGKCVGSYSHFNSMIKRSIQAV